MRITELLPAINACIDADIPVNLEGAPGIGKSDVIAEIAQARGALYYDIRLSMFDPVDLRGIPAIQNGETVWLRPSIWPKDESREIILFFDEMDRAAPAVLNSALQIVLNKRIGEHELPASTRVIAAGNGRTDKGTNKMSAALANRFAHFDVEADVEAWAAWANRSGIDPALIAFVRFRPALLHAMPGAAAPNGTTPIPAGAKAFPTPRNWARWNRVMDKPEAVRHAIGRGLVGDGPAGEAEAFFRMVKNLPSIAAILADPHGADVPSAPNERYAVASALARKADVHNMAAVVAYAQRLPAEFSVMTITDAARRDAKVKETAAYGAWAVANQGIQL